MIAQAHPLARLELAGNALSLDFANTLNYRPAPARDYLASYPELLNWSEYAGSLPAAAVRRLRPLADSPQAAAVLAETHRLRDTVFTVFSAIAAGRQPGSAAVERLSDAYAGATRNARIAGASAAGSRTKATHGGGYGLTWPVEPHQLDAPLWPVAHSAGELLMSGPLERIGECPSCGWLFLDTSRNGTRRWCSMATCGSRDKMARYHRRQRRAG
ncbi:MAG: CGNR zinc finger domain-containing protein [Sporichthyaceae bacterium]|nr:CGNR zinc finger domain-containing protein [Sporichthyaceae bacterium]